METNLPISAWPENERPRERLWSLGPAALSDAELVALLLGVGVRGRSALALAQGLLRRYCGLAGLGRSSPQTLAAENGVGRAKAARLLAACELGKRRELRPEMRPLIRCPQDAAKLIRLRLAEASRECFMVLCLDAKHREICTELVSVGSLDQLLVHPREVFKTAIAVSAAALIVAHNHPSGDPEPSAEDLHLTRRLNRAARLLGIRFLDHLVLGDGTYRSLAENGQLLLQGGKTFGALIRTQRTRKSPLGGIRDLEQKGP